MKSLSNIFRSSAFRKIVPLLFLSSATLVGSLSHVDAKETRPNEQGTGNHHVFSKLEEKFDAKLGIYALDTSTNQTVNYQSDERFAYTSTHKALAVGALLQQISIEDLNQTITYTRDDLVTYSPITENHVDTGMTLSELADASLRYSDNTAGNLILKQLGGPAGFKESLEEIGDYVTTPERYEPDLNEVDPGEIHDTSTPRALASSLQAFTLGEILPTKKRELLIDWMKRNTTGDALIRAGVPKGWEVADKTGAGSYGTRNDIAIIWPPNRDPIVLAVLSSRDQKDADYNDKLIAEATKEVIKILKVNK